METPFRRLARDRLPSPLAERFDPQVWREVFEELVSPTEDDHRLLRASLWIGEKSRALYKERPSCFLGLGSKGAIILAIATLNYECSILSDNLEAAGIQAASQEIVTLDYLSHVRFENAHGQRMSSGDYVEAFVDSLDAWLYDAARCSEGLDPPSFDPEGMVEALVKFYTARHVLKRLYDKALHLGHFLDDRGIWVSHDRALTTLQHAWYARSGAMFDALPSELFDGWSKLSKAERRHWGLARSVTGVRFAHRGVGLKVERLEYISRRAPQQALVRAGLRRSYLADFLDQPLPLYPAVTVALIEDAWWVCSAASHALRAVGEGKNRSAFQWANPVHKAELVEAVSKALAIGRDISCIIIDFLTYTEAPRRKRYEAAKDTDHGWRGLWTAPLVSVPDPDEDILLLPTAVFEQCAPLYRVEAWLEKGGLSDQGLVECARGDAQRGSQFERLYREQLVGASEANPLFTTSCVSTQGVASSHDFPHQIDVLIKLGSRLLIGELKFLLRPADPHQWRRHYGKLTEASEQARTKSDALAGRLDIAAKALGIEQAELEDVTITPLVIINNGFGFSLEVDGCRVVDATFLRDYLRSPDFVTGGVISQRSVVSEEITRHYTSEQQASDYFDRIMAHPTVLTRFANRITWDVVDYPAQDGIPLRIDCPFRGNMAPGELARRMVMLPRGHRTD